MDHAASEQDAVDVALQHTGHLANPLADLINHRIPGASRGLIARGGALAHLDGIGRTQKVNEATGLHAMGAGNVETMLRRILRDLDCGDRATARRRHGALAADDVVAVDHLALKMSRDRDAAANMANDEVALIIGATELCRMADGGLFKIKGVQVHVSIHALNARHTCEVAQLIGIGRIHHKRGLARL